MDDEFFLPDLCNSTSILFLVLITELLVLVLTVASHGLLTFNWGQLGLSSLFAQWVVLSSAGALCNLRPWLSGQKMLPAMSLGVLIILSITGLYTCVGEVIISEEESRWNVSFYDRLSTNLVIAAIVTGIAFRYLYLQYQLRRQERAELNARIQALQSRIRPHFLFNSMNIIASLISVDPELAEDVVEELSVLFRASLSDMTNEPVPLAEELALCRKYVHIEGLRLDDRLRVEWLIEVDENAIRMPMLTLQPLLENAIYHGIQPLPKGGTVTVHIAENGSRLEVSITNPVAHENHSRENGNRMALDNIRHRLEAVYGSQAEVVSTQDDHQYRTTVRYPLGM